MSITLRTFIKRKRTRRNMNNLDVTECHENFNRTVNVLKLPDDDQESVQRVINIMKSDVESRKRKPKIWTLDDFEMGMALGRGAFGKVYLVKEKKSENLVALKVIEKRKMSGSTQHQVLREVEIQGHLKHPNILKLYTYFFDQHKIYFILEYAIGGDLFTWLQKQPQRRFSEQRSAKYIYQVADALEFCHENDVIHRDLKPENILLDICDNVKLSDFGWSVHAPSNKRMTVCGTEVYLAPEMHERRNYNNLVDNWCLGILSYELLVGYPPFESRSKGYPTDEKAANITWPTFLSFGSIGLISNLVKYKPEERLSLEQVKAHPWIVDFKNQFMSR